PPQRVQVRFCRGGWIGPAVGPLQARLFREVQQTFPAWLDITVLDDRLRLCRGNTGTVFALLRRQDMDPAVVLPTPGETAAAP
ncbi:MAG: PAP/fibrillin family protein, partial [Cyanobacteriota bacterium]|nr:PAP/fibrillin family protein [Cyanobacteriota bacterium]